MSKVSSYIKQRSDRIRKAFNKMSSRVGDQVYPDSRLEGEAKFWTIKGNARIKDARLQFGVFEKFLEIEDEEKLELDTFRYVLRPDVPTGDSKEFFVYEQHPHVGELDEDNAESEEEPKATIYTVGMHLHPYKTSSFPLQKLHYPCTLTFDQRDECLFELVDWLMVDLLDRFNAFGKYDH